MSANRALAHAEALDVASATGVDARIVLAGPGARAIAFVLDWLIRSCLALVYALLAALLILGNLEFNADSANETLWYLLGAVPASAIYFLYHLILEPVMRGRTPGKRMIGIRILTVDGLTPGTGPLIVRNILRIIDSMPVFYVVGLLFVMLGRRHARLGDLAAGTVLAVERAPFLERLGKGRGIAERQRPWREARERAAALSARRGSGVADALGVVEDYQRAARELTRARAADTPAAQRDAEYLESVYANLHDTIHRRAERLLLQLKALLRDRLPEAVSAMRWHLFAVTTLFIVSAVTGFWLIYTYPDLIKMFASPGMISTVERGELWTEGMLNVTPSAVLSVSILTNNIMVSLFAFVSGIIFGLGTFYMIAMNGLSLGAVFAFTGQHGIAGKLFDFVLAHGCVELSCICLAGAAGAYVGEALIRPGERTRSEAFRAAAAPAMVVLAAVTALLVFCGLIEGFVSPDPEVPRWARATIGAGYWLFMISLLRGQVFGRSRCGQPVDT